MQTQQHRLEDRQEYHVTVTQCLAPERVPRVVKQAIQGDPIHPEKTVGIHKIPPRAKPQQLNASKPTVLQTTTRAFTPELG